VDDEIVKLRDLEHVTSIIATHQIRDAFYVATHEARRVESGIEIVAAAESVAARAEFMVLHDGHIVFEGDASELLAADNAFLKEFLYETLPPW
jgi:phospholipid/cholesterol/gamma-HCH transport system ATP-binding protein